VVRTMIREYINNVNATQDSWFASNPFYFIRIDSIDHGTGGIQKYNFTDFAAGDYTDTSNNNNFSNNFNWIYLKENDASTSITFTKSITIPSEGYYLIELMINKRPSCTGSFDLSIAGSSVWDESGYNQWDDYGTVVRVPIQYLTAGAKSFVLTAPKFGRAGWIKVSRLTRFEGGNGVMGDSETRLDLIDVEFTQNGITALDTMTLKIAMHEDYYSDNSTMNPLVFDALDHITLTAGQSMTTTVPMFGGYISGWNLNEDRTILTIECVDRLWDLKRTMIWRNFSIGYIPSGDSAGSMPFTQFPTVQSIARYLSTALYHIDYQAIEKEYIIYNPFSQETDVTDLTSYGFDKQWEIEFGNPGTCMRLIPTSTSANYVKLYSSLGSEYNAADFNHFNFDYYASGAGVKYPITFNIEIDMYKADEAVSAYKTYYINFNGPTPSNTKYLLGKVQPQLDGTWHNFTCDLKAMFDKVAPSSAYYIKEIRIVGKQDSLTVLNRRCSSIYIDQVMAYKDISSAPKYASADSKSAFDELQDLCEKTNHIAYVRPGMERSLDQLIILPKRYFTIPITLDDTNIMSISTTEYKPLEWGMLNWAVDTFNYSETRSGNVSWVDGDHEKHYGPIMDHEFLSDVTTEASAATISKAKVNNGIINFPGFEVTLLGTSLIEPGQYITVELPKHRLNGLYEIVTITHKIDFVNTLFTTSLSFGRPSFKFLSMMKELRNAKRDIKQVRNNAAYAAAGSLAAGLETSLGAYNEN